MQDLGIFSIIFLILGDVSEEVDKGRCSGAMGDCAKGFFY